MKACHAIASVALLLSSVAHSLLPASFPLGDHGASIPAVGLGTYLARGPELRKAVQSALDSGLYTHIDTAASEWYRLSVSSPSSPSSRRRCGLFTPTPTRSVFTYHVPLHATPTRKCEMQCIRTKTMWRRGLLQAV